MLRQGYCAQVANLARLCDDLSRRSIDVVLAAYDVLAARPQPEVGADLNAPAMLWVGRNMSQHYAASGAPGDAVSFLLIERGGTSGLLIQGKHVLFCRMPDDDKAGVGHCAKFPMAAREPVRRNHLWVDAFCEVQAKDQASDCVRHGPPADAGPSSSISPATFPTAAAGRARVGCKDGPTAGPWREQLRGP